VGQPTNADHCFSKIKRNTVWQLFSGIAEQVRFGVSNYHWRRSDHSTIIKGLYEYYQVEGIAMPITWEDYYKDFTKRHLYYLTPEERLKGLPVEERLKGLSAKEIEAYLKKQRQRKRKRKAA
jgi:hypothetical protein